MSGHTLLRSHICLRRDWPSSSLVQFCQLSVLPFVCLEGLKRVEGRRCAKRCISPFLYVLEVGSANCRVTIVFPVKLVLLCRVRLGCSACQQILVHQFWVGWRDGPQLVRWSVGGCWLALALSLRDWLHRCRLAIRRYCMAGGVGNEGVLESFETDAIVGS